CPSRARSGAIQEPGSVTPEPTVRGRSASGAVGAARSGSGSVGVPVVVVARYGDPALGLLEVSGGDGLREGRDDAVKSRGSPTTPSGGTSGGGGGGGVACAGAKITLGMVLVAGVGAVGLIALFLGRRRARV